MDEILKLYPLPAGEIPLTGAYLAHELGQRAAEKGGVFVYANFIASLDGRIAVARPGGKGLMVPKATANERDWRLFQELATQADLLISSGRYLRDWAAGKAQEILQVDDPRFADLRDWRTQRGLAPHPDIAILSASLDFPVPPALTAGGRRAIVFTTAGQDVERVKQIESQGVPVIPVGESKVEGQRLLLRLSELGYRTVYSAAGPRVLHLLAGAQGLDRLYLTLAGRLLGGEPFSTLLEGPLLEPPIGMRLHHLYLDPHALDGLGQVFTSYDRA